jgi:hypothetical protein
VLGLVNNQYWFNKTNILGDNNYFDEQPAEPVFLRMKGEFWTTGSYPNTVKLDCGYYN